MPQTDLPLRDIHLPEAVSWWPPAIGWWILLALLIVLAALLPGIIRYLRRKPLKKVIKREFEELVRQHKNNPAELLRASSAFIRQLLMTYRGREKVAALTGDEWLTEVQHLSTQPLPDAVISLLKSGPYQKSVNYNEEQFIHELRQWLSHLPASSGGKT